MELLIKRKDLIAIALLSTFIMMSVIAPTVLGQKAGAVRSPDSTHFMCMNDGRGNLNCSFPTAQINKIVEERVEKIDKKWRADIGATAYWYDSKGSLKQSFTCSADVYDGLGAPENDAFCSAMVIRPNSSLMTSGNLPYINGSWGHYEAQFTSDDNATGVYKCNVRCFENTTDFSYPVYFEKFGGDGQLRNETPASSGGTVLLGMDGLDLKFCHPIRWNQEDADTWPTTKYIDRIFNVDVWFDIGGGGSAAGEYDLFLNFYRVGPFGEALLGGSKATDVVLTPTDVLVDFSTIQVGRVFDSETDIIEVEACAIPRNTTAYDIRLRQGGSTNSNFSIDVKSYEDPQDFSIGGSAHMTLNDVDIFKGDVNASVDVGDVNLTEEAIQEIWANKNESFVINDVSGTEYSEGELVKLQIQLSTISGFDETPFNTANCEVNVTYPNNTEFLNTSMFNINNQGVYETSFDAPDSPFGVYTYNMHCFVGSTDAYESKTFHLSPLRKNITDSLADINASVDLTQVLANQISINDTVKNSNSTLHSVLAGMIIKLDTLITGQNDIHTDLLSINVTLNTRFDDVITKLDNITANIISIPSNVWSFGTRTLTAFDFQVNLTQNAFEIIGSSLNVTNEIIINQTVENTTVIVNTTNETVIFDDTDILNAINTTEGVILDALNTTEENIKINVTLENDVNARKIYRERRIIEEFKDQNIIPRNN